MYSNKIVQEDLKFIADQNICWDRFRNKCVLVTGATGMLPSYIVFSLLYLNEVFPDINVTVVALARNNEKAKSVFKDVLDNPFFNLIIKDVCETFETKNKVDYIIHGASLASSQYYGIDPVGVMLPNILGTYNLLEMAKKHEVEGFLFFSSNEIYGKVTETSIITEETCGTSDLLNIRNCYPESKRMGELMCTAWSLQHKVPAKSVRISHTYGPMMDVKNDKRVFSSFVSDIINGRDIEIKSSGMAKRTFCYIADAVSAFLIILLNGEYGQAYNMCGDDFITINQLAKTLVDLVPNKKLKVICTERDDNEVYIENKDASTIPTSNAKLKNLGWAPKYSVSSGFLRTINALSERDV